MTAGVNWTLLGFIVTLVAPLYAHAGYMLWKRFQTQQNTSDIDDHSDEIEANAEAIQDIRRSLMEIEYDVELMQNDLQVIHDNVIDSNHCGSENCRWCDGDPDE